MASGQISFQNGRSTLNFGSFQNHALPEDAISAARENAVSRYRGTSASERTAAGKDGCQKLIPMSLIIWDTKLPSLGCCQYPRGFLSSPSARRRGSPPNAPHSWTRFAVSDVPLRNIPTTKIGLRMEIVLSPVIKSDLWQRVS